MAISLRTWLPAVVVIMWAFGAGCNRLFSAPTNMADLSMIQTEHDVIALFTQTPATIKERVDAAIVKARKQIADLIALSAEHRSYATVAHALDAVSALSDVIIMLNVCEALEYVSPDAAIRESAHEASRTIQAFLVDAIESNVALYHVFKAYAAEVAGQEDLTDEQRYFVHETLEQFQRDGLDLPEAQRARVAALKKEIAQLSQDFEKNIAQDNRTITVDEAGLAGVDPSFVAQLTKTNDGRYVLGTDYPTVFTILDTCSNEQTRKALSLAFNNRANPANAAVLERLIAARDELASLLGMSSFSELSLSDEMVGSPERAQAFLDELSQRAAVKGDKEFKQLLTDLPAGVTLTPDGKMKPWDLGYVNYAYKKKHLAVDEEQLAEYFPMESTVDGLLSIYQQFFSLTFEKINAQGLWHPDVTMLAVRDSATHEVLGYLILDLYPRPNKFTHACHMTIVPSVTREDGAQLPSLSVVIANFPRSSGDKPALLKRNDVSAFFHEFGHALHAILGRTHVASFSGTHVKRDFVEMPSQMLEEWLWDASILKMISRHYKTGEPLSDEMITRIQALKNFDSGYFVQRQVFLSAASLAYYAPGAKKDLHNVWHAGLQKYVPQIAYTPESYTYLSFGHLPSYGPRYYGYLWSKVFALDLFQTIKQQGLLNPAAGKRYVDEVIGRGGSKDPNDLLKSYLGREPRQDAFFADLGL